MSCENAVNEPAVQRRRISISDIHGKNCWRKLVDDPFDELYFLGDYFDDYDESSPRHQIVNFLHIVKLARSNPNVHLCLGNHDFQYLRGIESYEKYSGYQHHGYWDIMIALESSMDLIKPVYVTEDNVIVSHAGVTSTFLKSCNLERPEDINQRFTEYRMSLAHVPGEQYGDNPKNGPLWVRPNSLLADKLPGYRQVVGHTRFDDFYEQDGIAFTDVLDSKVAAYSF